MIYGGDMMSNFAGSMFAKDKDMTKDVILSEVHKLLDKNPDVLIATLRESDVKAKDSYSKEELISLVVDNLYDNDKFRKNVSKLIENGYKSNYSNADGKFMDKLKGIFSGGGDTPGGTGTDAKSIGTDAISKVGSGATSGGIFGAVAGAVDSIFGTVGKFKEAKNQKEADKQKLIQSMLADSKPKRNYLPIVLISGVLLIGGIVAYVSLKKK